MMRKKKQDAVRHKITSQYSEEKFDPSKLVGILKKGRHLTDEDLDNIRWGYLKKTHKL